MTLHSSPQFFLRRFQKLLEAHSLLTHRRVLCVPAPGRRPPRYATFRNIPMMHRLMHAAGLFQLHSSSMGMHVARRRSPLQQTVLLLKHACMLSMHRHFDLRVRTRECMTVHRWMVLVCLTRGSS